MIGVESSEQTRTKLERPGPRQPCKPVVSGPPAEEALRPPPRPRELQPGDAIKHYEIIRELGHGGMGKVFLARDTKLGCLVAIKLLLNLTDAAARQFVLESRITARCKHPSIVVIHAIDEHDGLPYM